MAWNAEGEGVLSQYCGLGNTNPKAQQIIKIWQDLWISTNKIIKQTLLKLLNKQIKLLNKQTYKNKIIKNPGNTNPKANLSLW